MTVVHALTGDGDAVEAIDEGQGPALLVVHPGSSDASSWEGVARLLTDEFRVVRVQRRLYAPDGAVRLPHTMAADVADVLAVAALLHHPLVVGHSSGAVVALEAALASPASFAAMALYEPPLATTSPVAGEAGRRARAALDAGDPVAAMEIHLRDIVGMPQAAVTAMLAMPAARAHLARFAAAQIADNEALDALGVGIERYATLDLPALLIEGADSPLHLRTRLADLAATLPNIDRVVTLAGQGHTAHLMAPDLLADVIRSFARRVLH
ncbi:MAG TPA: alpha/beta hydrolase [Thermoleophilia bacterium]|nr:alpha/beta hydrolase [Thermoleophilia bacterium]